MNAKHALVFVAAFAALPVQAADERVSWDQLPAPVRRTIDASRNQDPVKEVHRRNLDGRTVYLVELERNNAPNPRLRIAEDGALLREPVPPYAVTGDMPVVPPDYGEPAVVTPRIQVSDLPPAVQQTARTEAHGREVVDIDRETWHGRLVYEIEFRERGPNARIHVSEDGALLRDERPRRTLKSFFMGTQLEDTPAPVQETIRRLAAERQIADIDKKATKTGAVYRVEFTGPQGPQELQIAEDGKVLYDSRAAKRDRGD